MSLVNKYWVSQGESNAGFWVSSRSMEQEVVSDLKQAHEFSKHATCTSTFDVKCYGPGYKKHQDVVDFFQAVVRAFQQYPTYDFLAA
jgi:ribonuclease T2